MRKQRILALILALSLLLTSCGGGTAAATMHLRKTEGTVGVSDGEGRDIDPADDLGLYSGYQVGTQAESYAWIDLDRVKLTKMDADSQVEIVQEGKLLELNVKSGSLFFNVTEPLADDESMNIRTSSMMVGIRGTCGWVTQNAAALLEGTVEVTAGDQSVTVSAGEMAALTADGTLEVRELSFHSIPAFVARELLDDDTLQKAVSDASGLYIPTTYEELLSILEENESMGELVYTEEIDFEQDGSPELLMVYIREHNSSTIPSKALGVEIYRNGPEGFQLLTRGSSSTSCVEQAVCSLVESNGRFFVRCRVVGNYDYIQSEDVYFGSLAERDGGFRDWGRVDHASQIRGTDYLEIDTWSGTDSSLHVSPHDERGFVTSGGSKQMFGAEAQAFVDKYTLVRVLYEQSF